MRITRVKTKATFFKTTHSRKCGFNSDIYQENDNKRIKITKT